MDAAILVAVMLAQVTGMSGTDRPIPACTAVRCEGRRIKDNLGVLQFCVPRGLKVRREVGEHGDVHYAITARLHSQSFDMKVTSGPYFPGKVPSWANGCDLSRWHTPESRGEDCHLVRGDVHSRYMTLNTPMGYAQYKDVPREVAVRFDRLLDSLCWGDLNSVMASQ